MQRLNIKNLLIPVIFISLLYLVNNVTEARKQTRVIPKVVFTDAEDALIKSMQADSLDIITQNLHGKHRRHEVEKRCVTPGLMCGKNAASPNRGQEKWRKKHVL